MELNLNAVIREQLITVRFNNLFFIFVDYTEEIKAAVTDFRTITGSAAVKITPSLQYAHSDVFLKNAPPSQNYGSKSTIYRWELQADGAKLFCEIQIIKQFPV